MGKHTHFKKWGCMNALVEKKHLQTCKERDKGKRLREHLIVSSCKCTACWGHLGLYETMFWIHSQPPPVPSTSPCSSISKLCIYYNTDKFTLDGIIRIHLLRNAQKQYLFLFTLRLGHIQWKYDQFGSWVKWLSVGNLTRKVKFYKHVHAGKLRNRFRFMLSTFDVTDWIHIFIVIQHFGNSVQGEHG